MGWYGTFIGTLRCSSKVDNGEGHFAGWNFLIYVDSSRWSLKGRDCFERRFVQAHRGGHGKRGSRCALDQNLAQLCQFASTLSSQPNACMAATSTPNSTGLQ